MEYKKILSVIIVALFLMGITACSPSVNIVAKDVQEKSDKIKIGIIGPMSGQYAALGIANARSAELAMQDFGNVEIFVEDGKFDSKQAISAYQKLKNVDDIDALIVMTTPAIEALKPLIEEDKVPTVVLGQDLNTKRDYVFHIAESIFLPYVELGEDMREYENPVFLVQESAWSEEVIDNYEKGYGSGANIIRFNVDDSALTTVLKLETGGYDAFSIDATPDVWIPLYNRIDDLNLDERMVHVLNNNEEGNLRAQSFKDKVDYEFFEGKVVVTTKSGSNSNEEFMERYKQVYGEDIVFFGDFAYDAVKLFVEVNPKSDNWIDRVLYHDLEGVTGKIEWDENGDRKPLIVRGYIENSTLVEVN